MLFVHLNYVIYLMLFQFMNPKFEIILNLETNNSINLQKLICYLNRIQLNKLLRLTLI